MKFRDDVLNCTPCRSAFVIRKGMKRVCPKCGGPVMSLTTKKARLHSHKRTEYNGRMYDSKEEAEYAQSLDFEMMGKDSDLLSWEYHITFPLIVNGVKIFPRGYELDFIERRRSGDRYVEWKGYETEIYKVKKNLMKALYPDIEIIQIGKEKRRGHLRRRSD